MAAILTINSATASRSVTDGVTNSTTTVTSATATFLSSDLGKAIVGAGIPAGAYITVIGSSTSVTISVAATASASSVALTIGAAGVSTAVFNGVILIDPTSGTPFFPTQKNLQQFVDALIGNRGSAANTPVLLNTTNLSLTAAN